MDEVAYRETDSRLNGIEIIESIGPHVVSEILAQYEGSKKIDYNVLLKTDELSPTIASGHIRTLVLNRGDKYRGVKIFEERVFEEERKRDKSLESDLEIDLDSFQVPLNPD